MSALSVQGVVLGQMFFLLFSVSRISGVFRSCIRCIVSSVSLTLRVGTFVCVGDVFYAFWMLSGVFVRVKCL